MEKMAGLLDPLQIQVREPVGTFSMKRSPISETVTVLSGTCWLPWKQRMFISWD